LLRYLLILLLSSLSSYIVTPFFIKLGYNRKWVRRDAHKENKPIIPNTGGFSIFIGNLIGVIVSLYLFPQYTIYLWLYFTVGFSAFLIGFIDDIFILSGKRKMILTILIIVPIIISYIIWPNIIIIGRPRVPILGTLRLTIIYWFLLPLAIAGPANAINMLDIMNGIAVGTSLISIVSLLLASLIIDNDLAFILLLILLGSLIGYYPYNKYPSRVFNGDSGSLQIGGYLGAIALLGRIEFLVMTSILIHIVNAFLVVSSMGFVEHRNVKERPIIVNKGIMTANCSKKAPLSLTRLLLALGGPSTEKEIIITYYYLQLVVCILVLLTSLFMI